MSAARVSPALLVLVILCGVLVPGSRSSASLGVAIGVDFSSVVSARAPIGFTASTFGVEGGLVTDSAADQTALRALGADTVRIHLAPDASGQVVSGAGGGDKAVSGDRWLDTYAAMGLRPTVIVNLDKASALAVLNYVRQSGHDVRRYIIGNEMDVNSGAAVSVNEYVTRFREIAAAMRAVDPTLEIGGPATACFECTSYEMVDGLVRAPSAAQKASFVDYHAYGSGDGVPATMDSAFRYDTQLAQLRSWVNDPSVALQVGEFNMNWGNDPQNNTHTQTVWVAGALGSILSSGGVPFQYGDKNGALGLVAYGRPKASYWGLAMFTGGGLFRPIGASMVRSSSSSGAVRVFASTGGKNVVVVNTGEAVSASFALTGFGSGSADVWQSTDVAQPVRAGALAVSAGALAATLPARSVTTFVLSESVAPTPLGLRGDYFGTTTLSGPSQTRIDPQINFQWGANAPIAGLPADGVSVRWTGYVTPFTSERYTFITTSDDGIRLWVGGTLVVDAWSDHSWRDDSGSIKLRKGVRYPVRVEYYDRTHDAVAILSWQTATIGRQAVPADRLTPG